MLKVTLLNLPFADVALPSIALMQLKGIAEQVLGRDVRVRVLNLNNEVARALGLEMYRGLTYSLDAHVYGLGDWFFRRWALPDLPDNEQAYFARCCRGASSFIKKNRARLCAEREHASRVLCDAIDEHGLADEDVVGMTSMFQQNLAAFGMARELKRRRPEIVTLIGGANVEWPMGGAIVRQIASIDFGFSGPALKSLPRLLTHLHAGDVEACHAIDGVLSRKNLDNPSRNLLSASKPSVGVMGEDLPIDTEIPLDFTPFLDGLETAFGRGTVKPNIPFETSRGCWWGARAHCTFCGLNKLTMGYRAMSPERAIRQFERLFTYADRCARFSCVDNIMPKEFVRDVLPHVKPPPHVAIFYEVKADLSHEELGVLAAAGVKVIQPGIEALATSTLKLMRKGTSAFSNLQFLKSCRELAVEPKWNLLIGFPGESESVFIKYLADIPALVHLYPPSGAHPVRFDRFSPYFTNAAEYGLQLRHSDWYDYVYPFPPDVTEQFAYYFSNADLDAPYFRTLVKYIEPLQQRIGAWRARWRQGAAAPELIMKGEDDGWTIVDSRFREARRHVVSPEQRALLEFLAAPRRGEEIAREFGGQAETLLRWADDKQLLFSEDDRLLSVIVGGAIPRDAPQLAGAAPVASPCS